MIFSIFNKKDATIYERYSNMNTGLDAILEVSKYVETSTNIYNSRILLDFSTSDFVAMLPTQSLLSASYYLKLTATEASEIPLEYDIYALPISGAWGMGTGRLGSNPSSSNGVSWLDRLGTATGTSWLTASYNVGSGANWAYINGGGNWYTNVAYTTTQSFDYETADLSIDVTNVVKAWISGTLDNHGIILKRAYTAESSSLEYGSLKFFSKDSHTIYQPRIEVRYADAVNTGTNPTTSFADEVVMKITNLQPQYKQDSKVRFNVSLRPKYPTITFATSSNYLDVYQLPVSSSYAILDAKTDDVVVPFDYTYTKISSDSNGSYFKLYLNGLQPERYYRIAIKTQPSTSEEYVFDKNWIFKVTR